MSTEQSQTPKSATESSGTAAKKAQAKRADAPAEPSFTEPPARGSQVLEVSKFFEESRERLQQVLTQANGRFVTLRSATAEGGDMLKDGQTAALTSIKELNEQIFELAQEEVGRGYDWLKACAEAKTLPELVQIQSDYLRETMEARVNNAKTLTDLTSHILKSTIVPTQNAFAHLMNTMRKR
jgi:hypothetical protein